jgi:hypothetical protein
MATASVATAEEAGRFALNGGLVVAGYTGGVMAINRWQQGTFTLEGWSLEEVTASFLTGGATGFIPGEGFTAGFKRGAVQAGGAYALGQGLKGEPLNAGDLTASTVFGGLAGGSADEAAVWSAGKLRGYLRAGAPAAAGEAGVQLIGPTTDAIFSSLQEEFMKRMQNPEPSAPWTGPIPATGP